jgi:hypothetical protein
MSTSGKPLHIDIPVTLLELKAAFSVTALAFEGDLPASIFHLQLITKDAPIGRPRRKSSVFHTNAGHVTLHDQTYNSAGQSVTGSDPHDRVVGYARKWLEQLGRVTLFADLVA